MKEKTGFDVDAAIKHVEEEREEDKELPKAPAQRRVKTADEPAAQPARRTTPKYNVVNK